MATRILKRLTQDIGGKRKSVSHEGRRDIRALANPNDPDAWHNGISSNGLIAMALGYQGTHLRHRASNLKIFCQLDRSEFVQSSCEY